LGGVDSVLDGSIGQKKIAYDARKTGTVMGQGDGGSVWGKNQLWRHSFSKGNWVKKKGV